MLDNQLYLTYAIQSRFPARKSWNIVNMTENHLIPTS